MKRIVAVTTVVVVAVGGAAVAGSATGQAPGGTVGAGAVGSLSVTLKFDSAKRRGGLNPAVPRNKKRPKVMDIHGGNGDILVDGAKVGRVHGFDATTFEGAKKYKGGAEGLSTIMLDFGDDNLLFAQCRTSDDERNNPCAISGGTGRFAGARGTALEDFANGTETETTQLLPFTVTFIP